MSQPSSFLGDEEFNLPKLEEKVLAFWNERKIFEKSLEKNKTGAGGSGSAGGKQFVFYEGPPYANGKPAIHHVLARVVKDVVLRYKTMRGYYVPRRAGWDTHGLPVEMAAEKALGFKTKRDIEKFGVKRFNEEAKKQVWIHKDEWERLTQRIGYWLDLKNAYVTYAPEYIESIWWTLAEISRRGLLYKGHKVVPWCTRCGTSLSSHELAQGYKEVVDRSVYVKFKLKETGDGRHGTWKKDAYILSWTTTPWTLPGNVALAVGEDISYSLVQATNGLYIVATDLIPKLFTAETVLVKKEFKGKDLVGLEYEPLFEVAPLQKPAAYKIYAADFVTTTDGTGVVHTAVMYGEDDYELGKKVGLPQHHTVDEEGKFMKDVPALTGEYAKSRETEDHIFEHLRAHGTLLRIEDYAHEYPFCWRCGTAILYYARTSWFIAMSRLRAELLKNNETIHWMPEHVRDGRFGEWLREAKDWNLSRERYWGAPLPIWECAKCGRTEVVESLEQLSKLAGGAKNDYWVIRHGESENIILHTIDSGDQDFHLTKRGEGQIEKAAAKLKTKKIDLIFASDIPRAKESADIIAKALGVKKIIFDKRLHEINLGPLSGKPSEEYAKRAPTQEECFDKRVVPEAESLQDVRARAWNFLEEMERTYEGKNILIVSHEDTIWMLESAALGWTQRESIAKKIDNNGAFMDPAGVVEFTVKAIPRDDTGLVDLHRPFVDEITFACEARGGARGEKKCGGTMKRVREVADVWYDSGAMPYASGAAFPADYIAEGMDQTRGWFYTLLAIATALGREAPYRNVITFGLLNDKFGNKMSKSVGNVIEPFAIIDKYGVDAVRWCFFAGTPFGEPKNFDEAEVGKKLRQVHMIVYNSFVFWRTYAGETGRQRDRETKGRGDKGTGGEGHGREDGENVLDRWILARLDQLVASVTEKLDAYQIREAAFDIEAFVDDLSRWYIRRSRRRLQRTPKNDDEVADYEAAAATLGFVLRQLIVVMAPFTPFFSEILYSAMGGGKESVHLEDWPGGDHEETRRQGDKETGEKGQGREDEKILQDMKTVRELAALGLAARAAAKIKLRQPLASMTVRAALDADMQKVLADEVNVKKIIFDVAGDAAAEGDVTKDVAILDTTITPDLRDEGWVREVARMVQELRQAAKLEPKGEIALMVDFPSGVRADEIRAALEKHELVLKADVGARVVEYKKSEKFDAEEAAKIDGHDVWIGIRKLS